MPRDQVEPQLAPDGIRYELAVRLFRRTVWLVIIAKDNGDCVTRVYATRP